VNDGRISNEGRVGFHTTRWDLVLNSGNVDSPLFGQALAELCSIYWYPLYAFARHKGYSEHDAQDLTQSFFLHLLEKMSLKQARPERGRFRSFLLASFQNHISGFRQRASAAKRGGGYQVISLDAQEPQERSRLEPAEQITAETLFDAQWAKLLLERVTTRLEEEYQSIGKKDLFDALRRYLAIPDGEKATGYENVARQLRLTAAAVKSLVFRLRKRFGMILRHEVAQTVLDSAEIDAEIHALYGALFAAEGRLER